MCVVPCGGRKAIRIKVNQEQGDLKRDRNKRVGGRERGKHSKKELLIYWLTFID